MLKFKISIVILLGLMTMNLYSRDPGIRSFENDPWVKSELARMTVREKIGQLIIIDVYPGQSEAHKRDIMKVIGQYKPGGILIMNGSPVKTARWINDFQKASGVPLLVAADAETGLGFRLDSISNFPVAQSLGAVQDTALVYEMGRQIGRQLKSIGINMNFAPVADINTNPDNPVINIRSFGEQKENVALKVLAYAKGLQDERVAAVAKHFPGHGDTRGDSHRVLPLLQHSAVRMDSVEMHPFRVLAQEGIAGIMTAHLAVPVYDPSGRPASLSRKIVNGILREKLGYRGLVITDAMNMASVVFPSGSADVEALKAGNDMLEFVTDLPKSIAAIEKAIFSGTLREKEIDEKCARVLAVKRWLGLNNYAPADLALVTAEINNPSALVTRNSLVEASLTVVKNSGLLPLARLDTLKIATLAIGEYGITPFQRIVSRYGDADHYSLDRDASFTQVEEMVRRLKGYNLVIAGIHGIGKYPRRNYNATVSQADAVQRLVRSTRVITLFFGNAYALRHFPGIEWSEALVVGYEEDQEVQERAVQMLFGALDAGGRLPVTADKRFPAGMGVDVKKNGRLKYCSAEEAGISSTFLTRKLDSLAYEGLTEKAFPGCQVLVAKDGKVIFHKCYGYLSYDGKEAVTPDHLYDFASVTKVSGPLPALMKLVDEGKLNLDRKMSYYWQDWRNSNKANIVVREVLAHQARLPVVIPFWTSQLSKNPERRKEVFKPFPTSANSVRVASNLYMERRYIDTMYAEIRNVPLLKSKKYTYTCMGFLLWPPIIEKITGIPYEQYLKHNIYRPLGATMLTYNPYLHFPLSRIAPTEEDDYFRNEVLRGFVHDEGAALLGGISGNAGLFGTANDLAKLFQMYLWKGSYGGVSFFSEKTVKEFTRVQYPGNNNRRGLGFDKPSLDKEIHTPEERYPTKSVSPSSYGHTGYTGTFVWADPEKQLLFIFLSNRVHPTRYNNNLSYLGTRYVMLQTVCDAVEKGIF